MIGWATVLEEPLTNKKEDLEIDFVRHNASPRDSFAPPPSRIRHVSHLGSLINLEQPQGRPFCCLGYLAFLVFRMAALIACPTSDYHKR